MKGGKLLVDWLAIYSDINTLLGVDNSKYNKAVGYINLRTLQLLLLDLLQDLVYRQNIRRCRRQVGWLYIFYLKVWRVCIACVG
jgi:hypothetical protein